MDIFYNKFQVFISLKFKQPQACLQDTLSNQKHNKLLFSPQYRKYLTYGILFVTVDCRVIILEGLRLIWNVQNIVYISTSTHPSEEINAMAQQTGIRVRPAKNRSSNSRCAPTQTSLYSRVRCNVAHHAPGQWTTYRMTFPAFTFPIRYCLAHMSITHAAQQTFQLLISASILSYVYETMRSTASNPNKHIKIGFPRVS